MMGLFLVCTHSEVHMCVCIGGFPYEHPTLYRHNYTLSLWVGESQATHSRGQYSISQLTSSSMTADVGEHKMLADVNDPQSWDSVRPSQSSSSSIPCPRAPRQSPSTLRPRKWWWFQKISLLASPTYCPKRGHRPKRSGMKTLFVRNISHWY